MISVRGIVVRVEGQQLKSVAGSAGDSANLLGDSECLQRLTTTVLSTVDHFPTQAIVSK